MSPVVIADIVLTVSFMTAAYETDVMGSLIIHEPENVYITSLPTFICAVSPPVKLSSIYIKDSFFPITILVSKSTIPINGKYNFTLVYGA